MQPHAQETERGTGLADVGFRRARVPMPDRAMATLIDDAFGSVPAPSALSAPTRA
ncbi:hypothetical protein ABZ552_29695 [Nocardia sp. NPDC019219]|uniref:hypothetical protein n=1 Tax=Nocardia sp. NPDC019219 TaxID=3154590 RepID=UPI0033E17300